MKTLTIFGNGSSCNINSVTLSNGATVISMSPHSFKFSDGSILGANNDLAELFTLEKRYSKVSSIKGMGINSVSMYLTPLQESMLTELCLAYDVVLVPFPLIAALKEQGIRHHYNNALAYNPTQETQRSPLSEKVVDINNWSW